VSPIVDLLLLHGLQSADCTLAGDVDLHRKKPKCEKIASFLYFKTSIPAGCKIIGSRSKFRRKVNRGVKLDSVKIK